MQFSVFSVFSVVNSPLLPETFTLFHSTPALLPPMLLSMTRIIQAESASIREIRAAGPDQIGGRLERKTLFFKPIQSNSNRFKPKNTENRFPSNPGLYRLLPPVTAHYDLLPPKNARRDFPPSPDLTGANRTYPDLKNVKTSASCSCSKIFALPHTPPAWPHPSIYPKIHSSVWIGHFAP